MIRVAIKIINTIIWQNKYMKTRPRLKMILVTFWSNKGSLYDNYFLSLPQWQNFHGPEFVKMASEPCVALSVPSSIMVRIYIYAAFEPMYSQC